MAGLSTNPFFDQRLAHRRAALSCRNHQLARKVLASRRLMAGLVRVRIFVGMGRWPGTSLVHTGREGHGTGKFREPAGWKARTTGGGHAKRGCRTKSFKLRFPPLSR